MLKWLASTFVLFALTATEAAAQQPPKWQVRSICKNVQPLTPQGHPYKDCVRDEEAARSQLYKQWRKFSAKSRSTCVQESSVGGPPSYVDALTCMQLFADNPQRKTP